MPVNPHEPQKKNNKKKPKKDKKKANEPADKRDPHKFTFKNYQESAPKSSPGFSFK